MEINYCESGHPFTTERCVQRLITEYNKHKNLIIAFDFDNTVFDYHKEGNQYEYDDVIDLLKYCYDLGMTLVLYTCEENIDKIKYKNNKRLSQNAAACLYFFNCSKKVISSIISRRA